MASPQKENGFTAIANEILEALARFRIPGQEMQCLLFILRKTYGFQKKADEIALKQFVEATGIRKNNVCRAIKTLESRNIISVIKNDNRNASTYKFNKNYSTWKTVIKIENVIKIDNRPLSKMRPSKENITKEKRGGKKFIPPTLPEVISYFAEKGFSELLAKKAFEYYEAGDWKDSTGKQVRNWKQKMIAVWFKPEHKTIEPKPRRVIRAGDQEILSND